MQVEISYNPDHDGIELSFPDKPDESVLSELKSHKFRWHRRKKLWYVRNNPEAKAFAESLRGEEISLDFPEPAPPDGPSFEATEANLEDRNYSFVRISYQGPDGNSSGENFIIFEPQSHPAEVLSQEFAKERHGPAFEGVVVHPKNYIIKARGLFQRGRIIGARENPSPPAEVAEDLIQDEPSNDRDSTNWQLLTTIFPGFAQGDHLLSSELKADSPEMKVQIPQRSILNPEAGLRLKSIPYLPNHFRLEYADRKKQLQRGAPTIELACKPQEHFIEVSIWSESASIGLLVVKYRNDDPAYTDSEGYNDRLQKFLLEHIELAGLKIAPKEEKKSPRQQLNDQIEELIRQKDRAGENYTAEDRELIIRYSGSGGLAREGKDDRGVLYEYYTPDELVRYCWALARKHGYTGGPVLEPACGTGNFLRYAPGDTLVTGYETNPVSARIAEILYPQARIINRPFDAAFFAGTVHLRDKFDLPRYELVIGNPPFGKFSGRYAGMGEKKFTGASRYEEYFILRGLDLLAPGGLLIYILGQSFLNSANKKWKEKQLEPRIERICDAFRLPERIFQHTTIGTDILILQKRI